VSDDIPVDVVYLPREQAFLSLSHETWLVVQICLFIARSAECGEILVQHTVQNGNMYVVNTPVHVLQC